MIEKEERVDGRQNHLNQQMTPLQGRAYSFPHKGIYRSSFDILD